MASTIILKKSSIVGRIPLATDLTYGELALNYADGLLYYKNASNTVTSVTAVSSIQRAQTAAGTTQATGLPVTAQAVQFTTVGASSGATLPYVSTGTRVFIANDGANAVNLYPPVGGLIDQAAANAPIVIAAGGMWEGVSLTTSTWTSISPDTQGTTNQISVTQGNGVVTLGLSSTLVAPGTVQVSSDLTLSARVFAGGTTGTSGQVLSSTGVGVQWATASGGGFTGGSVANATSFASTVATTSTNTGAVTVAGGVGIGGGVFVGGVVTATTFIGALTGTASTATAAATAYALANTGTTYVNRAVLADTATTATSAATAYALANTGTTFVGFAVTATNLSGGTAGVIHYQTAAGISGFISTGTTNQVLTMGATLPAWAAAAGGSFTGGTVAGLTTFTNTVTMSSDLVLSTRLFAGGTTGTNGQVLLATGTGVQWSTLSSTFNGGTITNQLIIDDATGAISTTTGALQVVGGAGIQGNLYVGGTIYQGGVAVGTGGGGGAGMGSIIAASLGYNLP
jgi:hypothetical protein